LSNTAEFNGRQLFTPQKSNMKTSARNQFFGKVSCVNPGVVNDEIELEVAGGHKITAVITHASTEELGLRVGVDAFALVKASSVILVSANESARFSARNVLTGTITRVQQGAINTEVVIDLPDGDTLAAIVTNESSHALELGPGKMVSAMFKASSVILAVPE
jgi:molybdate transport system regulatory protein